MNLKLRCEICNVRVELCPIGSPFFDAALSAHAWDEVTKHLNTKRSLCCYVHAVRAFFDHAGFALASNRRSDLLTVLDGAEDPAIYAPARLARHEAGKEITKKSDVIRAVVFKGWWARKTLLEVAGSTAPFLHRVRATRLVRVNPEAREVWDGLYGLALDYRGGNTADLIAQAVQSLVAMYGGLQEEKDG